MKSLQDNLNYYKNQKVSIIQNKESYQSVRHYVEQGPWQPAAYTFSGYTILREHGTGWWYAVKWGNGRFGCHMKNDAPTRASVRQAIAQKLGRPIDEISPDLAINARGETPTHWFAEKEKMFNTYTVGYQHRKIIQKEERFFDQAKYNEALRECEQNIERTTVLISTLQKQEALQREVSQVEQGIEKVKSEAAAIAAKIREEEYRRQEHERELPKVIAANKEISEKFQQQQRAMYEKLKAADDQQRTFFLAELWDREGTEQAIGMIKSLGFDPNDLAYLAGEKMHVALFDLALARGANCNNYFIEDKTLLQHLIHKDKDNFVQKVLLKEQDLICTLATAISQNDIATLDKVLSAKPGLLKQKFAGYTLLQIAISAEKPQIEVVAKLLQLDGKSAEILSNNGESALKIAIRGGQDEVVKLVSDHVNLGIELGQLGARIDQPTKDLILEKRDVESVVKLFRGEEISVGRSAEESDQQSIDLARLSAEANEKAEKLKADEEAIRELELEQMGFRLEIQEISSDELNVGLQGLPLEVEQAEYVG